MATIKSWVKKSSGKIYIKNESSFDGMVDCVMPVRDSSFQLANNTERNIENTLGINGAWFVRQSDDFLKEYENDVYKGYSVSNCCGSFILAIKK